MPTADPAPRALVKVVYFDEESVADLLDISAGGRQVTSDVQTKERAAEIEAEASVKAAAKFDWLPFFGGSAAAGAAASASTVGRNILNKTLSNTILTDYLGKIESVRGIVQLRNLRVTARQDSAAYMKMYTPYLAMLKIDELPVNLETLDSALEAAKGYYELIGEDPAGTKGILRFNISAFRNNYGLVDLARMRLVFHGILVGRAPESSLTMQAEMAPHSVRATVSGLDVVDGKTTEAADVLNVYDILLAGVELGG